MFPGEYNFGHALPLTFVRISCDARLRSHLRESGVPGDIHATAADVTFAGRTSASESNRSRFHSATIRFPRAARSASTALPHL